MKEIVLTLIICIAICYAIRQLFMYLAFRRMSTEERLLAMKEDIDDDWTK